MLCSNVLLFLVCAQQTLLAIAYLRPNQRHFQVFEQIPDLVPVSWGVWGGVKKCFFSSSLYKCLGMQQEQRSEPFHLLQWTNFRGRHGFQALQRLKNM